MTRYTDYDKHQDLLVIADGGIATDFREATSDLPVRLFLDGGGSVVGIEVPRASSIRSKWSDHPVRRKLPRSIVDRVDEWVAGQVTSIPLALAS